MQSAIQGSTILACKAMENGETQLEAVVIFQEIRHTL